jgi:mRNA-degrading endonuclease RelE of RelBE toxin-antitoxin system
MPLTHDFSDELKAKLKKLLRKDKRRYQMVMKKMKEVAYSDEETINRYKNLRYDLKDEKRVHINGSFVLTFKFIKEKQFILFTDFDHHDKIYQKKKK